MAINAVGIGPLIVTGGAAKDVAAGSETVMICSIFIGPEPSGRMRVFATQATGAHAARLVTAVTGLRAMTA